jgi:hypothetical protein
MPRQKWSVARKPDLAADLDILLGDLCVIWGFCNQLSGDELVRKHQLITGDIFAQAVLEAEGMDAETELTWRRKIKQVFTARYGQSVSARDFTPRNA